MQRFRVQENVPSVYVEKSRDFQMMCNVFDLMNNGVKFDIDTIKSLSDTTRCPQSLIKYLQHKLGFYSNVQMSDDTLRIILKCFPYLVRLKGSKRGVVESICLFLTTLGINGKQRIEVTNYEYSDDPCGNYIITLSIQHKALDVTILKEILKYIIPTGYIVKYSFFQSVDIPPTVIGASDMINITFVDKKAGSGIRASGTDINTQEVLNSVSATTLIDVTTVESTKALPTVTGGMTSNKLVNVDVRLASKEIPKGENNSEST